MIIISKKEKEELVNKGCMFGSDIHRTYTHHPHYYLTESRKNLGLLRKIRKE